MLEWTYSTARTHMGVWLKECSEYVMMLCPWQCADTDKHRRTSAVYVRRPFMSDGQGRGMYWQGGFSVQGEMQICRAFKTPTMLLHFLLRVNSQQTAADQYQLKYRRYRYRTDTTGIGPIPIPSTGISLSLVVCLTGSRCGVC